MTKQTFTTVAIAAAITLAGCTSHPAPTPVAKAVSALTPSIHDPVAEYNQYRATSQLASGLLSAGMVAEEVKNYYEIHDKLPAGARTARAGDARKAAKFEGPGGPAGSVSIGPAPGVITVTWASGVLAGKTLVLEPVRMKRDPYLCWKVGAATTVRADVIAHATVPNRCNDYE